MNSSRSNVQLSIIPNVKTPYLCLFEGCPRLCRNLNEIVGHLIMAHKIRKFFLKHFKYIGVKKEPGPGITTEIITIDDSEEEDVRKAEITDQENENTSNHAMLDVDRTNLQRNLPEKEDENSLAGTMNEQSKSLKEFASVNNEILDVESESSEIDLTFNNNNSDSDIPCDSSVMFRGSFNSKYTGRKKGENSNAEMPISKDEKSVSGNKIERRSSNRLSNNDIHSETKKTKRKYTKRKTKCEDKCLLDSEVKCSKGEKYEVSNISEPPLKRKGTLANNLHISSISQDESSNLTASSSFSEQPTDSPRNTARKKTRIPRKKTI